MTLDTFTLATLCKPCYILRMTNMTMHAICRSGIVKMSYTLWPVLLCILFFFAHPASACSVRGEPPTDEQLFAQAASVFVAHLIHTEEKFEPVGPSKQSVAIVEGEFRLLEVLKGSPPPDNKVRDFVFGPGNCSLGLLAGVDYLFFIQDTSHPYVLWPTGSRPFINIKGTESIKLLNNLRRLASPAPSNGKP